MGRALRYHPLFDSDILNAAEWYDGRQQTLGSDFLARVRTAVGQLISDPARRASIDFGIRYWPVDRFPYVVFYDVTNRRCCYLASCIQTFFMIALLVSAIAVAWFDVIELFVAWYSESTPPIFGLQFVIAMLQISCCAAVVSVLVARFILGK